MMVSTRSKEESGSGGGGGGGGGGVGSGLEQKARGHSSLSAWMSYCGQLTGSHRHGLGHS